MTDERFATASSTEPTVRPGLVPSRRLLWAGVSAPVSGRAPPGGSGSDEKGDPPVKTTTDRFAAVPLRFFDALERDEINADAFLVGTYLVGRVDFETGKTARTLRALADGLRWSKSDDTLRRTLARLRELGWIEYETTGGQRRPYVIVLKNLARRDTTVDDEDPF